jgi:hypothetical protein
MRRTLEVADVFRRHGAAYREAHGGHLSRGQRRVMGAIETCRSATLGGHVEQCNGCRQLRIAYNSCLMGKFRNGESAGGRVADPADFQMIANDFLARCSP